jgi:hypothetical protein
MANEFLSDGEALEEARRRWGPNAFAERLHQTPDDFGFSVLRYDRNFKHYVATHSVGYRLNAELSWWARFWHSAYIFSKEHGAGKSWEEAFEDADVQKVREERAEQGRVKAEQLRSDLRAKYAAGVRGSKA